MEETTAEKVQHIKKLRYFQNGATFVAAKPRPFYFSCKSLRCFTCFISYIFVRVLFISLVGHFSFFFPTILFRHLVTFRGLHVILSASRGHCTSRHSYQLTSAGERHFFL